MTQFSFCYTLSKNVVIKLNKLKKEKKKDVSCTADLGSRSWLDQLQLLAEDQQLHGEKEEGGKAIRPTVFTLNIQ